MATKNIFVTGATGKIGIPLIQSLCEGSDSLTVLSKNRPQKLYGAKTKVVVGDLTEPESYASSLEEIDTVLHMAAVTHTNRVDEYYAINAEATLKLIHMCKRHGVKKFILMSTRAIGGHYSRSKLLAEKYVQESGLDWIIVRLSEVYGIGAKTGLDYIMQNIQRLPFIPIPGNGEYELTPVYIKDVISYVKKILEITNKKNRIYNITGPESFTYTQFVDKVMALKHVRQKKIFIPIFLFKAIGIVLSWLWGSKVFVKDQLPRLICKKSNDNTLAVNELGLKPSSFEDNMADWSESIDFDRFSSEYTDILNRDLRLSGEGVEYFAEYKSYCVKECLDKDFRGRILDYGCGIGLLTKQLRERFDGECAEIVGYDESSESIKKASKNVKHTLFTDNLEKLGKKYFDVVIIANVLHHVSVGKRQIFLNRIMNFLKKGGYIFIFEHNPYNLITRCIVKSCILDKNVFLLRLSESISLLYSAGATIFVKRYIVFFPKFMKMFRFIEPRMGRLPFGAQYMCVGKAKT